MLAITHSVNHSVTHTGLLTLLSMRPCARGAQVKSYSQRKLVTAMTRNADDENAEVHLRARTHPRALSLARSLYSARSSSVSTHAQHICTRALTLSAMIRHPLCACICTNISVAHGTLGHDIRLESDHVDHRPRRGQRQ